MDLFERTMFFAVGGGIGFVLGYIVARLHEIKEGIDEVVELEHAQKNDAHDDKGSMRIPAGKDLALLLVVFLVVFASIASQRASNKVEETQSRLTVISTCTMEFLSKTVSALNERTQYSQRQAEANVSLQKAQAEYLAIVLIDPPVSDEEKREALQVYFDTLTDFLVVSQKSIGKIKENPFPTNKAYASCLSKTKE